MTSMKDHALAYAARGWPVFPVRADKTPYTKHGVQDATTTITKIEEMWEKWPKANIAMNVGAAGMLVIDLDPGHDMKELESNIGPLPKTRLSAKTPRDGLHLYFFLADEEVVAPSASKLAPHVDVRSLNSYVLLPPSTTADGSYVWQEEGKPAHRTDEMVRVANSGREKHEDRDNWLIERDLPENVDLAAAWLRDDAKIAVEGQGGDALAYATAAYMKSFGISPEMAFDLMWEHWNPRCSPPWDAENIDHLERKIENGYHYNTSPPGNVTPAYTAAKTASIFKPVVVEKGTDGGAEHSRGRFRVVDFDGMQAIGPPSWLIDDFLPQESYALLFGAPGTFKTFVALDIALTVATGFGLDETAVWQEVEERGPVLFLAGEGRSNISNRVMAWTQIHFHGNRIPGFHLGDPVPMISEKIEPFIDTMLSASPDGYKLVVLDTVGRSMQGVNENAQENASAFTSLVEVIQKKLGAAVLALHHTGFQDTHRARGSSVFGADADTIVRLDRLGKQYMVAMTMTKQKDAPEWTQPKHVKLNEIHVTPEVKSLVAVRPGTQDDPAIKEEATQQADKVSLDIVEDAVMDVLAANKIKEWQWLPLGRAISAHKGITLGEQTLAKNHLPRLLADNARRSHRCYDTQKDRWRWAD